MLMASSTVDCILSWPLIHRWRHKKKTLAPNLIKKSVANIIGEPDCLCVFHQIHPVAPKTFEHRRSPFDRGPLNRMSAFRGYL